MRASVHDIDALSPAQTETWNSLLAGLPFPSPFLSHAFCRAVHDVRGGVRVLQIEADDGARGFLPFQIRTGRGLLGHAEKAGGALSDMFGIVGTIRSTLDPQDLLRAARLSSLRFDHAVKEICPFHFDDPEETSGVRVRVKEFGKFLNDLAQSDEQFVGMVAAGERRLAKKFGAIRFNWYSVDTAMELDRVIRVKREQYCKTSGLDGLAENWKRNLLHNFLQIKVSPLCYPVLSTLYAGDNWIASHFGLACADTFHIWFPAFDPCFGRFGPGHMLLFKILERGVQEGFRCFDFGQGEATYKSRYRGETYTLWKGAIRRPSILGCSERLFQSMEWRIQKRAARQRAAQIAREVAIHSGCRE